MKKQILFMMFLSLAFVFAGVNKAFGQYINYLTATQASEVACTPAVELNCSVSDDALHPIPGKTYTYSVNVNPAIADAGTIHWFVTDQNTIIDGTGAAPVLQTIRDEGDGTGDYILLADPAIYDIATNTNDEIEISWQYFDATTNEVLLVAYVMDNEGCTNNVEVYRIEPSFGFTLDIAGLLMDGSLGDEDCVSPVESATYDGIDNELDMDYGENWVFFTVNAANFVDSWMPTFTNISYTGAGTVDETSFEWAYPDEAFGSTSTWNAATVAVEAQDPSGAVGPTGECIVVRARIDHGNDELDASGTGAVFTFGVDGIMYNAAADNYTTAALADMDDAADPSDPCVNDYTDRATYTLTPRPEITTNTEPGDADQPLVPKN